VGRKLEFIFLSSGIGGCGAKKRDNGIDISTVKSAASTRSRYHTVIELSGKQYLAFFPHVKLRELGANDTSFSVFLVEIGDLSSFPIDITNVYKVYDLLVELYVYGDGYGGLSTSPRVSERLAALLGTEVKVPKEFSVAKTGNAPKLEIVNDAEAVIDLSNAVNKKDALVSIASGVYRIPHTSVSPVNVLKPMTPPNCPDPVEQKRIKAVASGYGSDVLSLRPLVKYVERKFSNIEVIGYPLKVNL